MVRFGTVDAMNLTLTLVCTLATCCQRVQCGGPRPWAFQWCRCGLRRGSPRSRIDCYIALQPCRKRGKRSVQTVLQTFTVSCVSRFALCDLARVRISPPRLFYRVQADYLPVIKTKQRTAFPPNYIHSLDSAHMMLTAIACSKAGEWHMQLFI